MPVRLHTDHDAACPRTAAGEQACRADQAASRGPPSRGANRSKAALVDGVIFQIVRGGTRPSAPRDQRRAVPCIFGAIGPEAGAVAGLAVFLLGRYT